MYTEECRPFITGTFSLPSKSSQPTLMFRKLIQSHDIGGFFVATFIANPNRTSGAGLSFAWSPQAPHLDGGDPSDTEASQQTGGPKVRGVICRGVSIWSEWKPHHCPSTLLSRPGVGKVHPACGRLWTGPSA